MLRGQPGAAVLWAGERKQLSSNREYFKAKEFRKVVRFCQHFTPAPSNVRGLCLRQLRPYGAFSALGFPRLVLLWELNQVQQWWDHCRRQTQQDGSSRERGDLSRAQALLVLAPAAVGALACNMVFWILHTHSKTQPRHLHIPLSTSLTELQVQALPGLSFSTQSGCTVPFTWHLPKQLLIQPRRDTIKRLGECTNSI